MLGIWNQLIYCMELILEVLDLNEIASTYPQAMLRAQGSLFSES